MAHIKQTKRGRHRSGTSMRRALRREASSTVGLLVDAEDFAVMRHYRSFVFDDHSVYLRQIEGLLRTLAAQGMHTTVALFDPEDYAEFCTEAGLDPHDLASRSRFVADIASAGATVAYTGQPLDSLIPLLVSRAVRRATWEYATMLLAGLGDCADCGQDVGRAAFDRASHLLTRLLESAGPGTHHVVCSTPTEDEQLIAVVHTERDADGPVRLGSSEGTEFVTVLAVGVALETRGGLVLRTTAPDGPDRVHGWRLVRGGLVPLTAGEVFSAYCTDADTGEPVSPESGVEYRAGFDIGAEEPETHH
ncbi:MULTISPECIES: hypothetical protein [Streptomyces]|uniref:Uncharacterized protein n=1 Tax=Streptomyces clavifer TaxID=68188 RepID=A0ABS4VFD6_9ACTN|nr:MULTISPECIES: hypothetical protein [Streptomyces]KQX89592.1 hypothetical protein ASD26_00025 [Streptomyces sp. Root1319]KQZ20719.1 hypothetical protein ASD51_24790 [Streptomyces sp. Root55]MBP2362631.1 hypothetical protein [Streptomyces clavifer]MDX2745177.1 hypothetical protein [Streptomyces sp. NRRL_B-2557]MDX3067937.1 hypothetical protein [Streptomyces sp. ND04-05B]